MKLAGQVAVVTGAGRGIGQAIALAQASAGAKVALLARTAAEIDAVAASIAAEGGVARAFAVDIVDLDGVTKAFAAIERDLGPVSLLTNNAGAFAAIGPIWTVDPGVLVAGHRSQHPRDFQLLPRGHPGDDGAGAAAASST